MQGALLQQLLTTPVNFQQLFKTSLESLTLKHWNLTDEFLDNCIAVIQLNNTLQYLNLDFNDFKRRDHVEKILRVNRKLVNVSLRDAKRLDETVLKYNEPVVMDGEDTALPSSTDQNKSSLDMTSSTPSSGKKSKEPKDSKDDRDSKTGGKSASSASKNERASTPGQGADARPNSQSCKSNLLNNGAPVVPEPEMLVMTADEVREFRRAKLYKNEIESGGFQTVPGVFLSEKIERRDRKLYFPGNGVFKRLVF